MIRHPTFRVPKSDHNFDNRPLVTSDALSSSSMKALLPAGDVSCAGATGAG